MSPTQTSAARRRQTCNSSHVSVRALTRLHLCAVTEAPEVRIRHVAAFLAFTPMSRRVGNRLQIRFEHGPTAMWLTEALASKHVRLLEVGAGGGLVDVATPQIVLGRYGFRDGRWFFGRGMAAAEGVSRGAIHAAGVFDGHGLKVASPSAPMMLTLTAVLARLGINAKLTEGEPRAAIAPADVPAALEQLGIAAVAEEYRRIRETKTSGDRA
ncbi:hypothetical protein [Mycolicibacterium neoaurum]|uniref:hypothetical protein n=1 Tax=Mycolicibacterium neoaurum TaxID=1795 RepID=UPI001F4CCE44|nr:hypothetical protein [Mycolicibacterium neoaurum]